MPRQYQIIPKNSYPTEETYVNDNTVVQQTLTDVSDEGVSFLIVTSSPKGKDNVVQTIRGQQEFKDKIGLGPYSLYGQPLTTAYALASTGRCILHMLRVVSDDARYANTTVCAQYKVDADGKMVVRFYARPSTEKLGSLDNLETAYTAPEGPIEVTDGEGNVDEENSGWTEVKLFAVAALGRGTYGNNYQIRLSSLTTQDRENDFKNYAFELYEKDGSLSQKESFHVAFSENAIIGTRSYYADAVIGDPNNGSEYVKFVSFPEGFEELANVYAGVIDAANAAATDGAVYQKFTVDDIDIFGGVNKYTKQNLPLYDVDTTTDGVINPYGTDAYPDIVLSNGDDGELGTLTGKERQAALDALYLKAYSSDKETAIDPLIKSKNKFPTTILPDLGYSKEVKNCIAGLNEARTDCIALFDAGLDIKTTDSVIGAVKDMHGTLVSTYASVDAYCGKIRDPYNQKIITVTSTYALCLLYANSFYTNGGKHVPLADNTWGNLEDFFLPNTIYPVFDEDIHSDVMNDLIDERINFARNNANGQIRRATQTTRQQQLSVLSELNNVFVLKDVKRAMEKMCAAKRYNFAEPSDIALFNIDAANVAARFNGMVRSITASFGQNSWEAEMSIVHLYVTMVCRNITKTTIIEIDVNRE